MVHLEGTAESLLIHLHDPRQTWLTTFSGPLSARLDALSQGTTGVESRVLPL